MLHQHKDFEQVGKITGSWSVFECEYYPGKFLYVALPTKCGEDDGFVDICSGLSRAAAFARRDEKAAENCGRDWHGAL